MISELQLKNLLKHYLVLEFKNKGDDALYIKEYLPLCAALLYPYTNSKILEDKNKKGSIIPIIISIKKHTNRHKSLHSYSLEGLRRYFSIKWIPLIDIDVQKSFLKGISLISDIQEDGSFTIIGNERVHDNYLYGRVSYPDISNNYGTEEYLLEEGVPNVSKGRFEPETSEKPNKSLKQNTYVDNSQFIRLYDELKNADPENRNKARFVWQWFLRLDEYNAIKECIRNHTIPLPSKWDAKTVHLLSLYIGEFYKREYENKVNPFSQLGENSPNYGFKYVHKISELLNIEVYKTSNQAHLHSLYVNGGLPVHYISSKLDTDKSNQFIDGLSKLIDAEDEIDKAEGEEALEKVNNTALRESFYQGIGHSIFEYIQAIMANNKTWDESDNEYVDFCDFTNKIKEANKKATDRKKFKLYYTLWTYVDIINKAIKEFEIKPQLRFNPEEDGERHYAISKQRLVKWGCSDPPAQFSLRIGNQMMLFTKCCNDDYISWDMVDRIDLPIINSNLKPENLLHPNLHIIFDRLNGESHQIKNDINIPYKKGFLQFYTDDDPAMALWNSFKGAQSFKWSSLLYDKKRYHLLSHASMIDLNEHFGWVYFTDYVIFEDSQNGKTHTFYNSKGRIYAKPSPQSLHKKIIYSPCIVQNYLLDGLADCSIDDKQFHAYIVKSSNIAFDIYRVADDEKVNSIPIIEYKNAQEYIDPKSSWNKYNSNNLKQGLYVFRLSNARYTTETICYVLPEEAKIEFQSASTPYLIKFKHFTNVKIEGLPSTQRNDGIDFRISDNNVDSINVTLGDRNGNIILQLYHPKPQSHIYLYGIEIKQKPILIAYADEIEVKHISSNSCIKFRLSEKEDVYKRLFVALTATITGNKYSLLIERIKIKINEQEPKSTLDVRVYTQEIQNQYDSSAKMLLLDFTDNQVLTLDYGGSDFIPNSRHDMLLFQSLKDIDYTDVYYVPKFISTNGQKVANEVKTSIRKKRLTRYVEEIPPKFLSDYAFQQFEIACEHKLFFAVFDSLISMCWDAKKKTFLEVDKTHFKRNMKNFLLGYIAYTTTKSKEPLIAGLKRLAREFLFDWKTIKKDVENNSSQQLKEIYQELINN